MDGNFHRRVVISRILRNSHFGPSFCKRTLAGLLLVLATVSATAGVGPFLRPDAKYVLVAGLPGDLENESTYRDQLKSWLEILRQVRPKQVVALTDNPESISPSGSATTNSPVTFLASSRSNFLAASSLISGSTNLLVVIVWGHGGRQGSTPVFHVRGPRITPADLSAFAEKTGSIDACWILSFRGSGFFAGK